jgi:hypothetical protein
MRNQKIKTIFFLLILLCISGLFSEELSYTATVTDTDNNTYTLKDFSVSGYKHFTCRLRNSFFKVDFNTIRSVQITETEKPEFDGYSSGTISYASGGQISLFIRTENYSIEGIEENLGIKLTIPLSEINTINIIPDI